MASDELVVNRVHSSSTAIPGRALNQVRTHQLVIDEPTHLGGPGEQVTPAEAFLAEQRDDFAASAARGSKTDPGRRALASFCQALLSSNAFLYVD